MQDTIAISILAVRALSQPDAAYSSRFTARESFVFSKSHEARMTRPTRR
jgi:hypothetical protein